MRGRLYEGRDEYQFDAGIVGKYKNVQVGAFGSTLFANIDNNDQTGKLSQLSISTSYLIKNGSIGAYLTEAIKSEDRLSSSSYYNFNDLVTNETYMTSHNTYGLNIDYTFANQMYIQSNVGVIDSHDSDISGRIKIGYPLPSLDNINIFIAGGFHDTGLIGESDDFMVGLGIELSNWRHNIGQKDQIRPMQVPAITYAITNRTSILKSDINFSPEATITASAYSGPAPLTVNFSGFGHDPDGTVTSYQWNFGDGAVGTGSDVSHTFTSAGTFPVTLTVTDNKGAKSTATTSISTINMLPNASVLSVMITSAADTLPATVSFIGQGYDQDGTISKYLWNFGDGESATGAKASHTYASSGTYTVTFSVFDNNQARAVSNVQVTIPDSTSDWLYWMY